MPYIKDGERDRFQEGLSLLPPANDSGELNYLLTKICIQYIDAQGHRYKFMNDVVGALDNAKDEFRRRIQHPYEDRKAKENGDVYS